MAREKRRVYIHDIFLALCYIAAVTGRWQEDAEEKEKMRRVYIHTF